MPVAILPATLRDMTYVAADLRDADRREILAVFPGTPGAVAAALFEASADLAFVAAVDGRPVCAFGVAPLFPGLGSGWAYGTPRMPAAMAAVTRFGLTRLRPLLLRRGYRRLEVRSAVGHDLSHRWLERLGFVREGLARDYGAGGLDFVTYAATRHAGARAPGR